MAGNSANRPLGLGIVGAGKVSDYHHVPAIALDSRTRLAGVCDSDSNLAQQRSREWGVKQVTTDPAELISWPEIDAVIIATPNFTHRPLAEAAARAGKHL